MYVTTRLNIANKLCLLICCSKIEHIKVTTDALCYKISKFTHTRFYLPFHRNTQTVMKKNKQTKYSHNAEQQTFVARWQGGT